MPLNFATKFIIPPTPANQEPVSIDILADYEFRRQYSHARTPIERLCFHAFTLGLTEFVNFSDTHDKRQESKRLPSVHSQARAWINDTDQDYVFSFEALCLMFGFTPSRVRTILFEMVRRHRRLTLYVPRPHSKNVMPTVSSKETNDQRRRRRRELKLELQKAEAKIKSFQQTA